ncbi:hypothetical protein EDC01DRAFT_632214 [Geopyxis carbonaria]|nr:hypothetical protein EDC01DRAFT_632214 [Geopyxis carbonaria]
MTTLPVPPAPPAPLAFTPAVPKAPLSPFHAAYFTRIITLYHQRLCSTWTSLTGLPPPASAKPPTVAPLTLKLARRILKNFREHQRWFRTISVVGEGVWPLSEAEREGLSLRVVMEHAGGMMGIDRREKALVDAALRMCKVLRWIVPSGSYDGALMYDLECAEREQRECHGALRLLQPLWKERGLV